MTREEALVEEIANINFAITIAMPNFLDSFELKILEDCQTELNEIRNKKDD
jgi:hypothetical protein